MSRGGPRVGPTPALLEADPDADLAEVLARVPRFECQGCGKQQFSRTECCSTCGAEGFDKVPGPGEGRR